MDGPPPPPPPPPHGANPRSSSSGLPPGNYDIFIIPPHSAGSGFLYLPSLQPHWNSFIAGVACTLLVIGLCALLYPIVKLWITSIVSSGGMGLMLLMFGLGTAAWAWGKMQTENASGAAGRETGGSAGNTYTGYQQGAPPPNGYPNGGPNPRSSSGGGGGSSGGSGPHTGYGARSSYYQQHSGATPGSGASSTWEKAREETRQKEEARKRADDLRRAREEEQKRKDAADRESRAQAEKEKWEQMRAREKEAREREARERIARERLAKEKEAHEKIEREVREKVESEAKAKTDAAARAAAERAERLKDARERAEREKAERLARQSGVPPSATAPGGAARAAPSPTKGYERPTATSCVETETSFRPYDTPLPPSSKRHSRPSKPTSTSSFLSESSYAPSASTARTTPPPSTRGPYTTKDPDKIVLKAVYLFSDSFPGKPLAQLRAGEGNVTDGLVLRVTTEGLFIDDDVRGVGQREWDVKAWGIRLVEVWCPRCSSAVFPASGGGGPGAGKKDPFRVFSPPGPKPLSAEEVDVAVEKLLRGCKNACLHRLDGGAGADDGLQTGESKASGLHIVRASIRDTEGKKYVFVLADEEGWKVAVGLQRLRRGSQVRSLGVQGMGAAEVGRLLGGLGW